MRFVLLEPTRNAIHVVSRAGGSQTRIVNSLCSADVYLIGDLVQKTSSDLMKVKNLWGKSLVSIEVGLKNMGLKLGMELSPSEKLEIEFFKKYMREKLLSAGLYSLDMENEWPSVMASWKKNRIIYMTHES